MPWKETSAMDQRILFIADYLSGDYTKSALCRHYGTSRRSGVMRSTRGPRRVQGLWTPASFFITIGQFFAVERWPSG